MFEFDGSGLPIREKQELLPIFELVKGVHGATEISIEQIKIDPNVEFIPSGFETVHGIKRSMKRFSYDDSRPICALVVISSLDNNCSEEWIQFTLGETWTTSLYITIREKYDNLKIGFWSYGQGGISSGCITPELYLLIKSKLFDLCNPHNKYDLFNFFQLFSKCKGSNIKYWYKRCCKYATSSIYEHQGQNPVLRKKSN
ncbi:MAG: hypothetical protein LBD23_02585 [Oscillospiraceae bacterium]|nr:hypothetical protein [Oscillospiraceae bacterium]